MLVQVVTMSLNLTSKLDYTTTKFKQEFSKISTKSEKLFKSRNMYSDFNYNYDYNLWGKDQSNKTLDYPQFATSLNKRKQENASETFPTRIYGLLPVEYDGGFVNDNGSSLLDNFYTSENGTLTTNEIQFSTPILYILCMMFIYGFIILVVCIYALYSHRKRIGYNYDEQLDEYSSSEEIDEYIREKADFLNESPNKNMFNDKPKEMDTNYINAIGGNTNIKLTVSSKKDQENLKNSLSNEDTEDDESEENNFICIEMKACKNSYEKLSTEDEQEEKNPNRNVSLPSESFNYLHKLFHYFPTKKNYSLISSNEKQTNSKRNQSYSNTFKNSTSLFKCKKNDGIIRNPPNINKSSSLILDAEKIFVENRL